MKNLKDIKKVIGQSDFIYQHSNIYEQLVTPIRCKFTVLVFYSEKCI